MITKKLSKILMIVILFSAFVSMSAAWWNGNWDYRKPIDVTEQSGTSFNNYHLELTVDTSTLVSSGKMRSDCGDLRFAGPSDNSLDYWIESGCNTASTDIWVETPLSASGTRTIYMYYGNGGATSNSNIESASVMYEDWSGGGYNGWTTNCDYLGSGGECSHSIVSDGTSGTYSIEHDGYAGCASPPYDGTQISSQKTFDLGQGQYRMQFSTRMIDSGRDSACSYGTHPDTGEVHVDGSRVHAPENIGSTESSCQKFSRDWTGQAFFSSEGGSSTVELMTWPSDCAQNTERWDDIRITNYADPQPSYSVGAEDTQNQPPNNPTNPEPYNGETAVSTSHNLNVDVTDDDGNSMDVDFYLDGSYEGTDYGVCDGCTASINPSLSTGQSYNWYAVADDGNGGTTTSATWSFDTVHQPNAPTLVAPSNGVNDVSTSQNLQVDVTHEDGHSMNVDFYLDDGSGYTDVGRDSGVSDGGTASINPNLDVSGDYSWYAVARASGHSTQSSSWSFQTEHNTGLDSISGPSNDPSPLSPTLEATVSHSDPSEELTVEFVNDDNGNVICSQTGITDTQTVTCDTSGKSFGSSTGTTYNWRVDLSGDQASESYSSSVQSFDTVSAPTVTLSSPSDNEENVATDSSLVADVSQEEGLELNTVITLEDGSGNFVDDYSVNSNPGQITFSDPDLSLSENYQWYADTSIVDSTYSQSDTSSTRTFNTAHDFRVDSVYPSDGSETVGVNDTVDVEVFHSSDRNIDVEFYFRNTASGTPNVTKTVTSSGSAVNATVDTENFDGFGEETGTTYNWSYIVSDGASDTGDITGEDLSYTTVYRPDLSLDSPADSETNVDIGGSLDIGVQQDDNIATGVTAQLNNASGSESGVATDTVIGTGSGTTASFSLHNFDFVEAGGTYSYNATGQINNPGDAYTIQSSTGLNTFTVSPKPEVTGIEPVDGKTGTPANPMLNVTVDHDESDQMTVEFYDWEKTGSEAFLGEETVAAGDTASVNISDEEIGDSPEVYRWYVNVTTESGTSWNNSADPYEFTVASIGSVDFNANTESGVNLNPDNAADQGLDAIVGQENIVYQVSNDVGADMPGIGFNVTNGADSEVFGEVDDVESGSSVTVDLGESSLIEEDQEGYEIYAFYQEAGTDFTGEDFRSGKIEFSTHVAEVEWVDPGQPGNQPINEYRVYYNNQSGQSFSGFDYVGSISDDDSGSFTAGVANLELGDSSSNECFRMVSWNVAGESNPTSEQCVGVVP